MKFLSKIKKNKYFRRGLLAVGWGFLAFAVINLVLLVVYHNRTYPGTTIQTHKVGSVSKNSLTNNLSSIALLPENLAFKYQDKTVQIKTGSLGITQDNQKTAEQAVKQRSWLPIYNFISPPKVPAQTTIDQQTFHDQSQQLVETFKQSPIDARIQLKDGQFSVVNEINGYWLDESKLQSAIQDSLAQYSANVTVPIKVIPSQVKGSDLSNQTKDLISRTQVSVLYKFKDKSHKLTPAEIASLHEVNANTYILSEAKVKDFIINLGRSWGIGIKNITDLTRDTKAAIQNKTSLDASLVEAPKKTYTYCANVRGVDNSELSGFSNKINQVLNSNNGWSLSGQIEYDKVASGCAISYWLTSADQMATFGSICDPAWSCTVSPYVVINYDRWKNGTDSWNQSGGNIEDYRTMAINHETGHWLGFAHRHCPGPGQLAPVMLQESIDLEGCKFNIWPTPPELDTLRQQLGL